VEQTNIPSYAPGSLRVSATHFFLSLVAKPCKNTANSYNLSDEGMPGHSCNSWLNFHIHYSKVYGIHFLIIYTIMIDCVAVAIYPLTLEGSQFSFLYVTGSF